MLFADTFFYIALLNPNDRAHKKAVSLLSLIITPIVTTDYVLIELADALSSPMERPKFLALLSTLQSDSSLILVSSSSVLTEKGITLFRDRPEKHWSLTDCISFVVMAEYGINDALTGDHHFHQADFKVLFTETS